MVWLRRAAIAAAVMLALLGVTAALLIATFDAERYKSLAIDWMQSAHQRTLVIDGPVALSVFPRLKIELAGLQLSEQGRGDEFAAIDSVALSVQLLPLLRKQLVVDRVAARGVRASLLRDAEGRRNIDDLMAGTDRPAGGTGAGQAEAASDPALRLDISAIELDDLRLRLRDEAAGLDGEIVLRSFTSGRLAAGTESPVTLQATLALNKPQALALRFEGRMKLALDFEKGSAALSGLQLDVQGDAAGVKGLSLGLAGALAWDGRAVRAAPLTVAIRSASLGGATLAPSTLAVERALFSPAGQRLELQALQVALAGRRGADLFEFALAWPRLAVEASKLEGSALDGSFKIAGPTALSGSFKSAAPAGSFDALRLPGVQLTLQGQSGARRFEAQAATDLLLKLGAGAAALDRLDLKATLADPGLQALQLALRGQAKADARQASWELEGGLNADRFESSGKASFTAAVPRIDATARFDSLDLNRLLAPEQPVAAGPSSADTPVPLDGLRALDGRFTLSARALAVRQYRVADARVEATIDGGRLQLSRLSGRTWGGSVDASGSADAGRRSVAIKLVADGVDVNALLKDVAGKDLLEGRGRVSADLQALGASVGALRKSLAGSAALNLRDGAVKGINLARTMREARAALGRPSSTTAAADANAKTDFTELSASAKVTAGVAHSDDLALKSPFLRIGGDGRFDIGAGQIDYTARATVTGSPAGQGGAELAALRGVTVPVRLTGPFEVIDWKIDWSGVAAKAVEEKLEEKIGEKFGDKLGGLLGGRPAGQPAGAASAPAPSSPEDKLKEKLRGLFR